jgi:Bacterial aa3 type cytochrome c oxidase subunit IV
MASGNDIKAAESTYSGFINLLKFGMVGVAIVAIIVIKLIA